MTIKLTSKELVNKLLRYAELKRQGSDYVAQNTLSRLKSELIELGIDPELLNMSGYDLEDRIYESIASQIRR